MSLLPQSKRDYTQKLFNLRHAHMNNSLPYHFISRLYKPVCATLKIVKSKILGYSCLEYIKNVICFCQPHTKTALLVKEN